MSFFKKRLFVFLFIIILLLLLLWLRHSDMIYSNDETDNLFKVFIDWIMILFNLVTLILIVLQIRQTNIQVYQQQKELLEHKKEYLDQQKSIIIASINYHNNIPLIMFSNLGLVGAYNLSANIHYQDKVIPILFESKIKNALNHTEYHKILNTIILPHESITPYIDSNIEFNDSFEIVISYNDVHNQSKTKTVKSFKFNKEKSTS